MGKKVKGGFNTDDTPTDTQVAVTPDTTVTVTPTSTSTSDMYALLIASLSAKNIVIFILVLLLILSFLGVNVLLMFGYLLEWITSLIQPLIDYIWSIFGYTSGSVINLTADTVADVAKTGIDIAEGTAHSIGNLLQNSSNINGNLELKNDLNSSIIGNGPLQISTQMASVSPEPVYAPTILGSSTPTPISDIEPDQTTGVVTQNANIDYVLNQGPINKSSPKWCYVGEMHGKRSCIEVYDSANCMSGKTYSGQTQCEMVSPSSHPIPPLPVPMVPSIPLSQQALLIPPNTLPPLNQYMVPPPPPPNMILPPMPFPPPMPYYKPRPIVPM